LTNPPTSANPFDPLDMPNPSGSFDPLDPSCDMAEARKKIVRMAWTIFPVGRNFTKSEHK
jgi:hypothetical protein